MYLNQHHNSLGVLSYFKFNKYVCAKFYHADQKKINQEEFNNWCLTTFTSSGATPYWINAPLCLLRLHTV